MSIEFVRFSTTQNSIRAWAKTTESQLVTLTIGGEGGSPNVTTDAKYFTGFIDFPGLLPDTEYDYTMAAAGGDNPSGTIKTQPAAGSSTKVLFMACMDQLVEVPFIKLAQDENADEVVLLGDTPYTDRYNPDQLSMLIVGRRSSFNNLLPPDTDHVTNWYDMMLNNMTMAQLSESVSIHAMMDNHEFPGNNWDCTPAGGANPAMTQVNVDLTHHECEDAFVAYNLQQPYFSSGDGDPPGTTLDPASSFHPNWWIQVTGELTIIGTDSHCGRQPVIDDDDEDKTMWGPNQYADIKTMCLNKTTKWLCIASSKLWSTQPGTEEGNGWNIYTTQARDFIDFLEANNVKGVFFMCGDPHDSILGDGPAQDTPFNYAMIAVGPISSQGFPRIQDETNRTFPTPEDTDLQHKNYARVEATPDSLKIKIITSNNDTTIDLELDYDTNTWSTIKLHPVYPVIYDHVIDEQSDNGEGKGSDITTFLPNLTVDPPILSLFNENATEEILPGFVYKLANFAKGNVVDEAILYVNFTFSANGENFRTFCATPNGQPFRNAYNPWSVEKLGGNKLAAFTDTDIPSVPGDNVLVGVDVTEHVNEALALSNWNSSVDFLNFYFLDTSAGASFNFLGSSTQDGIGGPVRNYWSSRLMIKDFGLPAPVPGDEAANYDGTTQYLKHVYSPPLDDGNSYTFSIWFRVLSGEGIVKTLYSNASLNFRFLINTGNLFLARARDSGTNNLSRMTTSQQFLIADGWNHVVVSGIAGSRAQLYVNGISDNNIGDNVAGDIEFDVGDNFISIAGSETGSFFPGCMSELYLNTTESVDLDDPAILARFIKDGKPVDLGAIGQLPSGNQPLIYAPSGDSRINLGFGGAATIPVAGPTLCTNSPGS